MDSAVCAEDMVARPDPATFELMRWGGNDENAARMFCDIERADGSPFPVIQDRFCVVRWKSSYRGVYLLHGTELEYFLFEANRTGEPVPLDNGSYFDLTTADVASSIRRQTLTTLEAMGIPVEYSFHEDAPSQHEIDLRYTDALTMADNVMTFRLIVRK